MVVLPRLIGSGRNCCMFSRIYTVFFTLLFSRMFCSIFYLVYSFFILRHVSVKLVWRLLRPFLTSIFCGAQPWIWLPRDSILPSMETVAKPWQNGLNQGATTGVASLNRHIQAFGPIRPCWADQWIHQIVCMTPHLSALNSTKRAKFRTGSCVATRLKLPL